MKIAILAGGSWHETELNQGLESSGHETLLLNSFTLIKLRPLLGRMSDFLVRVSNKIPSMLPLSRYFFYLATKRLVCDFNPTVLIIWSSFAVEYEKKHSWPVVLVRGSSHIVNQREVFNTFPVGNNFRVETGPSRWAIARELNEYSKALLVTVPTEDISQSALWGNATLAVNPYGFSFNEALIKQRRDGNDSRLKLMFAGQTSLRKGIDRLAKLALHSVDFVVSVYGPLVQAEAVFASANMIYKGNLGRADLMVEYQKHDVFVLLSREEGMARAAMEAVSSGLPILVTRATGLSVWCELGAGVALDNDFTDIQFNQALDSIAANKHHFQKNCFKISRGWSWKNHAELLVEQIEQELTTK